MTDKLATRENTTELFYDPQTVDSAWKLAVATCKANLFPSFKSPEAVYAAFALGADLGLKPMQALRSIYVVNGRASLSADAMVAVCQHSNVCEFFRSVVQSPTEAIWETKRKGEKAQTYRYTIEQARGAGLASKDIWKSYPERMLSARCKSFLARDVYPEIVGGLYDPDELDAVQPQEPVRVTATIVEQEPAPTPAPARVAPKRDSQPLPPISQEGIEELQACGTEEELKALAGQMRARFEVHSIKKVYDAALAGIKALSAQPEEAPEREPGDDSDEAAA